MRVLVAGIVASYRRIAKVLAGAQLSIALDQDVVVEGLQRRRYDLVLIGIDQDDARHTPATVERVSRLGLDIPVICVRTSSPREPLGEAAFEEVRSACLAAGARKVIDFFDFENDVRGNAAIHDIIEQVCPLPREDRQYPRPSADARRPA